MNEKSPLNNLKHIVFIAPEKINGTHNTRYLRQYSFNTFVLVLP